MMKRTRVGPLAVALGLTAAGAGLGAGAFRAAPPPAVIAVADLERVFANLEERVALEADLTAYVKAKQDELDKMVQQIDNAKSKVDALPEGPEQSTAREEWITMTIEARTKKAVYDGLMDEKRGEIFRGLYAKITETSRRLAQSNGYGLVLASDEKVRLPEAGQSQDVTRVISLKRMLYVEPSLDVTDQLVTMMNNEFKAGPTPSKPAPRSKK